MEPQKGGTEKAVIRRKGTNLDKPTGKCLVTGIHSAGFVWVPRGQFADNQILLKYTNFLADTAKETGENFFDLNETRRYCFHPVPLVDDIHEAPYVHVLLGT